MLRYALRRLTWLPIILFGVSLIAFVMLRTLPGQDPVDVIAGQGATEEQKQRIREELGLARPVFPFSLGSSAPLISYHRDSQYGEWVADLVKGDFGRQFEGNVPVRDQFARKFALSFELVLLSVVFATVLGIGAGIISAMFRNGVLDYNVRLIAVGLASVPSFFLLTLLVIIPANLWGYSQPVGGDIGFLENPARNLRLILPTAVVLGVAGSAGIMRLVRTTMLEVLHSDYIRTAQAKGLPQMRIIMAHALKNAATPILTIVGAETIAIFGGSIIAEQILSIRGVGEWFFTSALKRDLPVVQFLVVYTAFVVVIINLITDLSYAWADPRVKYS